MSECRCISSIINIRHSDLVDAILASPITIEIEQAANTLATIQSLFRMKRQKGQDWEPYLQVFENLPNLIVDDLTKRVWVPEPSINNILIADNEAPLYTVRMESMTRIEVARRCRFIANQGTAKWLRFYLDHRVECHPETEDFDYPMKPEALYRKAKIAMCEGLHTHVEWFRDNFSNPRITWLIWEFLDLFDYHENFLSERSAAMGQRSSIGKAKLYELLRTQAKREESLETPWGKTDYRHLESFLQTNDPVTFFLKSIDYSEIETLINTIPNACAETARSNSDFEIDYWTPFTRARSQFHNALRKDKTFQMLRLERV